MEEAENPKRNILLATVLVCLIVGALASIEVYAANLFGQVPNLFPMWIPPLCMWQGGQLADGCSA